MQVGIASSVRDMAESININKYKFAEVAHDLVGAGESRSIQANNRQVARGRDTSNTFGAATAAEAQEIVADHPERKRYPLPENEDLSSRSLFAYFGAVHGFWRRRPRKNHERKQHQKPKHRRRRKILPYATIRR